jgi:hypothetical protein
MKKRRDSSIPFIEATRRFPLTSANSVNQRGLPHYFGGPQQPLP